MKITPIREIGYGGRQGTILATYEEVKSVLGEQYYDAIDEEKVKAYFAFKDEVGRKGFVWCYKYDSPEECNEWSSCGEKLLLRELFGEKYLTENEYSQYLKTKYKRNENT